MNIAYALILAVGMLAAFAMGALITYRAMMQRPPLSIPIPRILRRPIQVSQGDAADAADAAATAPTRRVRL